jgi:plastocyanin
MRRDTIRTAVLLLIIPPVAAAVAIATVVFGSGGGGSKDARGGKAVVIKDFAFSPSRLQIKSGIAVTVTNADDTIHTLTADNHAFDTGHLSGGAQGRITAPQAGTYAYHCEIHNYMTGVIKVGS